MPLRHYYATMLYTRFTLRRYVSLRRRLVIFLLPLILRQHAAFARFSPLSVDCYAMLMLLICCHYAIRHADDTLLLLSRLLPLSPCHIAMLPLLRCFIIFFRFITALIAMMLPPRRYFAAATRYFSFRQGAACRGFQFRYATPLSASRHAASAAMPPAPRR